MVEKIDKLGKNGESPSSEVRSEGVEAAISAKVDALISQWQVDKIAAQATLAEYADSLEKDGKRFELSQAFLQRQIASLRSGARTQFTAISEMLAHIRKPPTDITREKIAEDFKKFVEQQSESPARSPEEDTQPAPQESPKPSQAAQSSS